MRQLPLPPENARDPASFLRFLAERREEARQAGAPVVTSITLRVPHLEPLAVLEAIEDRTQPFFFAEREDLGLAVAAAEPVALWEGSGPGRFREARAWVESLLRHAVVVGADGIPFGGPVFFGGFGFAPEAGPGSVFPAGRLFLPRWQVARSEGRAVAVANLLVQPDTDILAEAGRVLKAQQRFSLFDYERETAGGELPVQANWKAVGGTSEQAFKAAVERAVGAIRRGEFEKIVLARALRMRADAEVRPLEVVDRLRRRFPSCWTVAMSSGTGQVFVAATPERLVRVRSGVVTTAAIAGTAPRGAGAAADARLGRELLESEKNLHEHRVVIASILRRLREAGVEPDVPGEPRLLTLANVQHLHTPIRGTLPSGGHLLEVLGSLHPTPAMGGRPRDIVLPRLQEFEEVERGLYAGPLGWVDAFGDGEFVVGIRSGLFSGAEAQLHAGVGIVGQSEPDAEWRETEWKFAAMREALGGG